MSTVENLEKATQTADLLLSDLMSANRTADPVVHLHLMRLINAAVSVRDLAAALLRAMTSD